MWKTVDSIYNEMDREMVECRRKNKLTLKYTELEAQLQKAQLNLEKRMTFALLI